MCDSLKNLNALEELYLNGNHIGDKGLSEFAPTIKCLTRLTMLYLNGIFHIYKENKIGDKGVKDLSVYLCYLRSLKSLYLWGNKISDDGITEIAMNIKYLDELKDLYISRIIIII